MKTIKERAKEYAPDSFDPDYTLPAREGYIVYQQRNAYITGAMQQKAIDIDKACDWFSNYLDYLNMGICDENDWLRGSPESGKERFIKAMEE